MRHSMSLLFVRQSLGVCREMKNTNQASMTGLKLAALRDKHLKELKKAKEENPFGKVSLVHCVLRINSNGYWNRRIDWLLKRGWKLKQRIVMK